VTGDIRGPAPPPSWPQVIATTIGLWWQRRVREPGESQPKQRRQYRRVSVTALIIALVAVSATAVGLEVSRPASGAGRAADSSPALAAAAANRRHAATWIAAQVGHDVIVACDPLMCTELEHKGFPAADLAMLGPNASDPLGSGIVVSTTAVRSQLGTRLASVYAPMVIASFGTGPSQVQVRVTAPDGAGAYMAAETADLHARQVAGRELLGNKNLRLPAAAAHELAVGQVDLRLLITLAALAHKYPVIIRDFADAGPAAPGAPLRSMDITSTGSSYLSLVQAFLRAQRAPLLAQVSVHSEGQATVLTIEFTAPSPVGPIGQN
jgi:hypothetical protein